MTNFKRWAPPLAPAPGRWRGLRLSGGFPQGWGWGGALAPALVVLLGVVVGVLAGSRTALRRDSITACVLIPLCAAVLTSLAVAGLAALSTGSIGPGRLGETGPDPWLVGGLAALELAVGLIVGTLAGRLESVQRLRALAGHAAPSLPGERRLEDPDAETVPIIPFRGSREPRPDRDPGASMPVSAPGADTAEDTGHSAAEDTGHSAAETIELAPIDPDPEPPSDQHAEESPNGEEADSLIEAFSWENSGERKPNEELPGWRPPWRKR